MLRKNYVIYSLVFCLLPKQDVSFDRKVIRVEEGQQDVASL